MTTFDRSAWANRIAAALGVEDAGCIKADSVTVELDHDVVVMSAVVTKYVPLSDAGDLLARLVEAKRQEP